MRRVDNNRGFTAAEGILIIVLLVLLGAIGWFVYERSDDAKEEPEIATVDESANELPKDDGDQTGPTSDAMTLTHSFDADGSTVSFNYPADWKLTDPVKDEQAILTHTDGYTLRFIATSPDLSGMDVKKSEVTLGTNQFSKSIYSQGGIDSLILYTPKFDAPFSDVWLDLPNNVSETIIEEIEQILSTIKIN
ncbi:MAG: hypothetical protein M3P98_03920 [bacterium]|nr:hypothetical protein [bacterium]